MVILGRGVMFLMSEVPLYMQGNQSAAGLCQLSGRVQSRRVWFRVTCAAASTCAACYEALGQLGQNEPASELSGGQLGQGLIHGGPLSRLCPRITQGHSERLCAPHDLVSLKGYLAHEKPPLFSTLQ